MTLEQKLRDAKDEGRQEGRQEQMFGSNFSDEQIFSVAADNYTFEEIVELRRRWETSQTIQNNQ